MMREGGEGEAALVYFNSKADFAAYDKIILDPVTLWDADAAPEKFVTKKDRRRLCRPRTEARTRRRDTIRRT